MCNWELCNNLFKILFCAVPKYGPNYETLVLTKGKNYGIDVVVAYRTYNYKMHLNTGIYATSFHLTKTYLP